MAAFDFRSPGVLTCRFWESRNGTPRAFSRWKTERDGNKSWTFELPTFEEWTAARRYQWEWRYPWGSEFRPYWCKSCFSRDIACVEPVMRFPTDQTVDGVFDLAGSADEWTSTPFDPTRDQYYILGGSWAQGDLHRFQTRWLRGDGADAVLDSYGFRLLARPSEGAVVLTRPDLGPPVWRSGSMRSGAVDFDVALEGARRLWIVVSCKSIYSERAVVWGEPRLIGPDRSVNLSVLDWSRLATHGDLHRFKEKDESTLLTGEAPDFGLITGAPCEIAFELPAGRFDRFQGRVGIPDAVTLDAESPIEIAIVLER